MVDTGADVHQVDDAGNTPLTLACGRRVPIELITKLFSAGADPNQQKGGDDGLTPLCCAINSRNTNEIEDSKSNVVSTVKALLEAGADPNMKSANGLPPLFFAMVSPVKCDSITQLLLDAGADPKLSFDAQKYKINWNQTIDLTNCKTPWQLAQSIGDTKSIEQFENSGHQPNEEDLQLKLDSDARLAALLIGKMQICNFARLSVSTDEFSIEVEPPSIYSMGERVTYYSEESCREDFTSLSLGIDKIVQRLSSLEGWSLSQSRSEIHHTYICVASRPVFERMMISTTMSRVREAIRTLHNFESGRFKRNDEMSAFFRNKLDQQRQKGERENLADSISYLARQGDQTIDLGELFHERKSAWNDLVLVPDQDELGLIPT